MLKTFAVIASLGILVACDGGAGASLAEADAAAMDSGALGGDGLVSDDAGASSPDVGLVVDVAQQLLDSSADSSPDVAGGDVPEPDPRLRILSKKHRTREIDLGTFELDTYGYTDDFTFDVPEWADSVFVLVAGTDGVSYILSKLQAPDDTYLIPRSWDIYGDPSLCLLCDNRISSSEGTGTFEIPSTPSIVLQPGTYTAAARGFHLEIVGDHGQISAAVEPVRVRVLFKEAVEDPADVRIDLNLFFTGGGGVSVDGAPRSALVQETVDKIDTIYSQVGIHVGDVTYNDAPARYRAIETLRGEGSDLGSLFRASAGHDRAMNYFFVDSIIDQASPTGGFGMILGVAGGIPGPPLIQGTTRSGVAVVLDLGALGLSAGSVAAHEGGHYLGLYHTSEQSMAGMAQIHDQIEDSPQNDMRNLMFYTSTGVDPELTPGQGEVMRHHPLIYSPAWAEED